MSAEFTYTPLEIDTTTHPLPPPPPNLRHLRSLHFPLFTLETVVLGPIQ